MALTGPDGEQHSHLSPRERMLARFDLQRAADAKQPPALPPMRPDRGHWVGPGSSKGIADVAGKPAPDAAAAAPAEPTAARTHAVIDAMSALGKVLRDRRLTSDQKDVIVQAITVVAQLL
jgi:hypothetical protein